MILLLPFFISFIFFLLKSKELSLYIDSNILFGLLSWLIIIYELLYIKIEIFIFLLIWLLTFYWIINNNDKIIIGYIFLIASYLTISSTSLISFFISIEILSFIMIILINLYLLNRYPGILYYFFSGIFSALFILSIGYLYIGYLISYKFLNLVFFFKLSLAPFHILLPQIYNSLSPQIIFLIDIPYKILLFYLYSRIQIIDLDIIFIIIITILIGSIGAIIYNNLINIMIYSSLFHYGLLFIPLYFGHLDYFYFYLFIYSFIILIYIELIQYKYLFNINKMSYIIKIFWFILLFNLIGIPPFNGFFIKFYSLYLILYHHYYFLFFIISFGILLLTFTYLRLLLSIIEIKNDYNIKHKNTYFAHFISSILILSSFPIFL